MSYGEHHLWAFDPDLGKTREFTADELSRARGRELSRSGLAIPVLFTVSILIGNSDNRLTQTEWNQFVRCMASALESNCLNIHFSGGPEGWSSRQNFCWVVEMLPSDVPRVRDLVRDIRKEYGQDSAAFVIGKSEML